VRGEEQVERNAPSCRRTLARAVDKEKKRLAKNLAAKLRRAVISGSKTTMGRKVRPTIHQRGDKVIAGPHPMLFGTEFGMNRKSGWYADERFRHSTALQYFRHQNDGYWWNPTIRRSKPDADAAVKRALDEAVRNWG
jgi:hypothetical protein